MGRGTVNGNAVSIGTASDFRTSLRMKISDLQEHYGRFCLLSSEGCRKQEPFAATTGTMTPRGLIAFQNSLEAGCIHAVF